MEVNDFDTKAREWDLNPMHLERSKAIAAEMIRVIPFSKEMKALEFGAGTGLLSLLVYDKLGPVILLDSSIEMTRIMAEKIAAHQATNLAVLYGNLEKEDVAGTFDLLFCQMVLHHVEDPDLVLRKFTGLLNPGGYLAIADLYPEDGTFHGRGVDVHHGFDPGKLADSLQTLGCTVKHNGMVYTIHRKDEGKEGRAYPVFLLIAEKNSP